MLIIEQEAHHGCDATGRPGRPALRATAASRRAPGVPRAGGPRYALVLAGSRCGAVAQGSDAAEKAMAADMTEPSWRT